MRAALIGAVSLGAAAVVVYLRRRTRLEQTLVESATRTAAEARRLKAEARRTLAKKRSMSAAREKHVPGCMLLQGSDEERLEVIVEGPKGSPYEGGLFHLSIDFPVDFPFKPYKIALRTRVFHHCMGEEASGTRGRIEYISFLNGHDFNRDYTPARMSNISGCLEQFVAALANPAAQEPHVELYYPGSPAQLLRDDTSAFEATARAWTQQHATYQSLRESFGDSAHSLPLEPALRIL